MPKTAIKTTDPLSQFADGCVAGRDRRPVPLTATAIDVAIRGGLAVVTTRRTFRNAEDATIEATITIPVPIDAVLVGLKATIGDRAALGTAQPRAKAREYYEAAVDAGKTAVLHEEALPGIHVITAGHVPPGKEIVVESRHAQPLGFGSAMPTLRIPTCVGDVYGRSPLNDSDDLVSSPEVRHEASIAVTCEDGTAHLVGGALLDGRADVVLDHPIEILVSGYAPAELRGRSADGRAVRLLIEAQHGGDADLDAAILVDISGSMGERATGGREGARTKYDVVRAGLHDLAGRMRPTDSVSLWWFNTHCGRVSMSKGAKLSAALAELPSPRGGTEIGASLAQVIASGARDVLLITDGRSWSIDVHELARGGARISVVLVGDGSLDAMVGRLAAMTGGQVMVAAGGDADAAVAAAVAAMRSPVSPPVTLKKAPAALETLRGGARIAIAWAKEKGEAGAPDDVGAYAAGLLMPCLPEKQATELAVAHGLVSHLTSLVLVDEAGEIQEGLPGTRKVPLMAPIAARMSKSVIAGSSAGAFMKSSSPTRSVMFSASSCDLNAVGGNAFFKAVDRFDDLKDVKAWNDIGEAQERLLPGNPAGSRATRSIPFQMRPDLVDWTLDPEALRRGDLDGQSPEAVAFLLQLSKRADVVALAAKTGTTPLLAAIAVAALAAGTGNRAAGRVLRSLIAQEHHAETRKVLAGF